MKTFTVACIAFASVMAFAGTAAAEDLGGEGQIAISSDLQLSFNSSKDKPPEGDAGDSTTTIVIAPALDYFVAESISIGGMLGYVSAKQGDSSTSGIIVGPRVGYALPIGEGLAFWPKLGVSYRTESNDLGDGSTSGNAMALNIFAPIAIQPAEHFFIGIGPEFNMDLTAKYEGEDAAKNTNFGIMTQVGGYF